MRRHLPSGRAGCYVWLMFRRLVLASLFVLAACAGSGVAPDASPRDASSDASMEAAAADATVDGAGFDAALSDSGLTDAAMMDAATSDGSMGDAGVPCAVGGVPGVCIDVALCTGDRSPTPGLCPGPTEVQCCAPTTATACDESAMPQPNVGLVEEPGVGGCPDGMLPVGASLCVDRYEDALSLVASDGSLSPWSPYWNPGDARVRALSLPDAVPQAYINGLQAASACAEAGKRLCTDSEWLRACQGSAASTYPYGDTRMDGVCNDARAVHPAIQYFGTSASWIWSMLGNPCIDQLPDSLARTGTHPGCVSEDGPLDMMGNLHEWTSDPAGTFRGGFYVDTVLNGNGCLYRTTAHDSSHWDYSTGFRCCADRSAG